MPNEQNKCLKKRIVIICVGTNDPETSSGQLGPILSFIDYLNRIPKYQAYKPDRIYLISTADKPGAVTPTQRRGEQVRERLEKAGWAEVYHRILDVLDPTDYGELMPKMKSIVQDILREPDNKGAEIWVNVSPGTGQMEAVWMALINAGALKARALQVKSPWTEPDENKRVREVDLAPLFESDLIKIAHDLFAQYAFQRAAEVLEELAIRTPDWTRAVRAELFADLSRACAQLENFEYSETHNRLEKILKRYENLFKDANFQALKQLVEEQKEVLEKVLKGDLTMAALDLYASAERRLQLQHYVECIWRLWAIYELIVTEQAREIIRSACKLDPSFPLPFKLRDYATQNQGQPKVWGMVASFFGNLNRVPKYLGADAAEDIILRRRDVLPSLARFIEENGGDIERLAQLRHRAVHEINPPREEDCEKGQALIRKLLKATFNLEKIDYPFQPRRLNKIAEMISQQL